MLRRTIPHTWKQSLKSVTSKQTILKTLNTNDEFGRRLRDVKDGRRREKKGIRGEEVRGARRGKRRGARRGERGEDE